MKNEFSFDEAIPLLKEVIDVDGEFRIYPKGVSMLPLIRQNIDSVVLKKPIFPLKKNDVVLYMRNDENYVLHRIMRVENGVYTLCGDNQTVLEKGIDKDKIIAKMSDLYRKDKRLFIDKNLLYKIYCFVWSSIFIRKVVFKLKRILKKAR